ncbi:MAG: SoxXA-binding protein [Chromatiaceae bacterium]|nr:SoxXA-binding protein [Gammaproteobacteria bacterium]MCP5304687.1 SoxXA-binding protein [Chromatiaceae bacterium]MCP5314414.1 SoxXA-binding protein [Chromatiaceae bacterium]
MKRTLFIAVLASVAFTFGGCAKKEKMDTASAEATEMKAAMPATGSAADAYKAALADAKAEQAKAAKVGGEWRDTGKIIKSAEEAAAAGDYGKAKSLADKAAAQGRLGQQQAATQVNKGNPDYLYK